MVHFVPSLGNMRYNTTSVFIRAHCWKHGPDCKRQRAAYTNENRPGQGWPIGQLAHWLITAAEYPTAQAHIHARPGTFQQRQEARERFLSASQACREFADTYEAGPRGEEPRHVR